MDLSRAGLGHILIIGTSCEAVSCGPALARCQPLRADIGPAPHTPGAAAQDLPSLAKCLVILVEVCLLFQYTDKTTAVLFLCGRHEPLSCIDSNKVVYKQVMLVDISWTWLAVHRGNKLINKSSGHCQPFWINGNRAYNDHDQMMTFAWPGEPFGRDCWLVDRLLTTWQYWNDGLIERRPCPSTSAWRRPKESAWYEPWARAIPVGEFLGSRRPAGHVRSLAMFWCWPVSLLSWLTLAGSVAPLNPHRIR